MVNTEMIGDLCSSFENSSTSKIAKKDAVDLHKTVLLFASSLFCSVMIKLITLFAQWTATIFTLKYLWKSQNHPTIVHPLLAAAEGLFLKFLCHRQHPPESKKLVFLTADHFLEIRIHSSVSSSWNRAGQSKYNVWERFWIMNIWFLPYDFCLMPVSLQKMFKFVRDHVFIHFWDSRRHSAKIRLLLPNNVLIKHLTLRTKANYRRWQCFVQCLKILRFYEVLFGCHKWRNCAVNNFHISLYVLLTLNLFARSLSYLGSSVIFRWGKV